MFKDRVQHISAKPPLYDAKHYLEARNKLAEPNISYECNEHFGKQDTGKVVAGCVAMEYHLDPRNEHT